MKPLPASAAALALTVALGLSASVDGAHALIPTHSGSQVVMPAAPGKKTPTPSASPSPSATPSPLPTMRPRSQADIEGEQWVRIAWTAGGGLMGSVLLFFVIGALLRRKGRR